MKMIQDGPSGIQRSIASRRPSTKKNENEAVKGFYPMNKD
jgi:hypothetical protein